MKKTGKTKKFSNGGMSSISDRIAEMSSRMSQGDDPFAAAKGNLSQVSDALKNFGGRQTQAAAMRELPGESAYPFSGSSATPTTAHSYDQDLVSGIGGLPTDNAPDTKSMLKEARDVVMTKRPLPVPRSSGSGLNKYTGVYKKGGKVSAASSRGDGIAERGKTKGRMV